MKKMLLFCFLFLPTSCGLEQIKIIEKWDSEIDYYFAEHMYHYPEIIKNIEFVLDDLSQNVKIDFYECAEPGKHIVVFGHGDNNSSIGKCKKPFVNVSSDRLDVIRYEILHMLGLTQEQINSGMFCNNIKPCSFDLTKLKNIYGSRINNHIEK